MKLPLGFGHLDFGGWLYGLWAGVAQGGAVAVVGAFAVGSKDPYYALGTPQSLDLMWWIFVASGVLGGMSYLAKHPAPERIVVTTVETAVEKPKGTVVTTTVAETHTEPPKGDK